ncbi:hypothetical protein ACROYT_G011603 [Oculina patagonica]
MMFDFSRKFCLTTQFDSVVIILNEASRFGFYSGRDRRRRSKVHARSLNNLQLEDSFADRVETELEDHDYYNAEQN